MDTACVNMAESKVWKIFKQYIFWLCDVIVPENALRSLLEALTSPPYAPMQHLEREQALAKQFAEILHFTLSFDELKVRLMHSMRFTWCALSMMWSWSNV